MVAIELATWRVLGILAGRVESIKVVRVVGLGRDPLRQLVPVDLALSRRTAQRRGCAQIAIASRPLRLFGMV